MLIGEAGSCQAGEDCHFLHDDKKLPRAQATSSDQSQAEMSLPPGSAAVAREDGTIADRRQAVTQSPASRVVPKPVPQSQVQDPRQFQLSQIRRRFAPKETGQPGGGATLLKFNLTPSDPDFPFEMTALESLLSVPSGYPKEKPSLKVGNKDIPRGFALNVESGFERLVKDMPTATLLELMKALDKNLETFLSAPKAETIKIMPNKDTRHLSALPSRSVEPQSVSTKSDREGQEAVVETTELTTDKHIESFTTQQKADAARKRETEIRQLEARMKRLPLYKKSGDGIAYTLPIEPRKRAELPLAMQAIKTVQVIVPMLYPLQPCRVLLEGIDHRASEPVEFAFEQRSAQQSEVTLMGHINYLAQNMHILAQTTLEPKKAPAPVVEVDAKANETDTESTTIEGHQDPERSHVHYITRPPEWTIIDPDDASDYDSDGYSYDSEQTSDEEGGVGLKAEETPQSSQSMHIPERGTAISFPFIELYGIELLEVVTLNITVKCARCKEATEVKGLKNGVPKSESCRKCAGSLSIGFRRDLVHANAVRAGFLDLDGCVVGDMLPR